MREAPRADRRALLTATLGFALVDGDAPALSLIRAWLGTWSGIGLVAAGMARQGYDLSLTRYDERGWRATFYVTGMEHSATGATGSAFESTPWLAVQRAAWETLGTGRSGARG
jgi:hypothetical protein